MTVLTPRVDERSRWLASRVNSLSIEVETLREVIEDYVAAVRGGDDGAREWERLCAVIGEVAW